MRKSGLLPAVGAATVGALLITLMVVSMRRTEWPFPEDSTTASGKAQVAQHQGNTATAMRYVRALQEGNCDDAIALTLWMRERIEHVRLQQPDRVADMREELCRSLTDRPIEGNRLTQEGIEDQYLLAPGCEVAIAGVDPGPQDLERPAASRVWLKITYPRFERAPLGLDGKPIRALTAGITTSADEYVLKAGVIGNLEIDYDSIDSHWENTGGEG